MAAHRAKKTHAKLAAIFCAALIGLEACAPAALKPMGQNGFQPEADEARIWKESRELQLQFDRSGLVYDDLGVTDYVRQVAFKLVPPSVGKEINFEIKVLKHPTPNAFALPHGAFYIHTGMLAQMENEAQLAAVIGHEISHILRRHTVQSFRTARQAAAFGTTLGVIAAPAGVYGSAVILLGALGALAAVSGYSQALEDEADTEGLRLMVQAGYDPAEAVKVIDNLQRYTERAEIKEPFFFSTHPRLAERKASYQRLLDGEYRGQSGWLGREAFATLTRPAALENAALELARGQFALAQEMLEKNLALNVSDPNVHFLLAELFRQRGSAGDPEAAEKEYQTTIELDPGFADAHRGLGLLDYKKTRADLAREHFEKYLALNPAAKDRAHIEQYLRDSATGRVLP